MAFSDAASDDPFSASGGQSAFDVKTALLTLRKYFWIPILTGGFAVLLAFVYLKTVQPIYRSQAEIKVERRSATQAVSVSGGSSVDGASDPADLKTIEQSFISPMLMQRVVNVLDLTKHDGFIGKGRPASSVSEGELVGYLMGHSKVALVPDTRLIEISFENWNPEMAQKVTNAIVEQGVEFDKDQRIAAVSANVTYLQEEVRKLEANLRASEEKLNSYTQQLGNVSIDNELNITADKLRELNTRSTVVRSERMKLESDYEQIQTILDDPEKLLLVESIRKVPAVESLYTKVNELKNQVAKLEQRYGPEMPVMIQTKTELKQVEKALNAEVLQAPKSVEVALAAARRNEASSLQEQADQEKEVIKLRELSVPARVLQRQIEADKLTYEAALKRLNEELSQVRSQPVLLQLVAPAGPAIKANTSSVKVLATAAMAGLMVGAGLIFLIMQLDSSIKSVEDAETALKLAVLANVPRYASDRPEDTLAEAKAAADQKSSVKDLASRLAETSGLKKKYEEVAGKGDLAIPDLAHSPMVKDEYSMTAEAFRTLRASIQMIEEAGRGNLILVTSALPAEGKSFCSLNLGVALAQSGLRTLLVDAQLRTPVLEERIFASRGHRGLTDFLLGSAIFSSVIRSSSISNLDVVTAGSASPHPAEILSRTRLRDFLDEAQQHYDRIVFDSASITPVSDTLCFARFFPVICLVVRLGRTTRRSAERALELLGRSGAKPFGVVMNFAAEPSGRGEYDLSHAPRENAFTLDFPKTCKSCGRVYEDFEDYLKRTQPPADDAVPAEAKHSVQVFRLCQCGNMVVVPSSNRRDFSSAGVRQREIFGELLDQLVNAGRPREEARAKLLLTLKIWRNEIYSDSAGDTTSKAGQRRHQLFTELIDQLAKGGLQREDAQAKILLAIKIWHDAP